MDCPARYRALPFEWTVGKRRSDGRFLQKSWPVNFEGIPASAGAPSNHEADAGLPATYFSRIKCRPGVRDSECNPGAIKTCHRSEVSCQRAVGVGRAYSKSKRV